MLIHVEFFCWMTALIRSNVKIACVCFILSIHPPEHFKKKYEVDEMFFTDEVYFYLIYLTIICIYRTTYENKIL